MHTKRTKIIESLQLLRFVAAFGVVFAHVDLPRYSSLGISPSFFSVGAMGVDIFFVLSGFIMAHVSESLTGAPLRQASYFFLKRIFRVAPLYALFTALGVYFAYLATTGEWWLAPNYPMHKAETWQAIRAVTFTNWDASPIYGVGWTLIYEFWFYAIFSIVILTRINKYKFFAYYAVLVLMVAIGKFSPSGVFRIVLDPLMIEFAFGVLLHWHYRSSPEKPLNGKGTLAIATAAIFLSLSFYDEDVVSFLNSMVAGGGAIYTFCTVWTHGIAAVLIMHLMIRLNANFRPAPIFVFLGDASYSMYLTHWAVVTTLPVMLDLIGLGERLGFSTYVAVNVAVAVLATVVVYIAVERPLNSFFSSAIEHLFQRNGKRARELSTN